MVRPKVLILEAQVSAGTAAVQSLGRAGAEVHGTGPARPLAFRSRFLARSLTYPDGLERSKMLRWIRHLDALGGYTLVIPATEVSVQALQGCDEGDDLRRRSILASRESVEIALDKVKTWRLAQSLGISVPASDTIESAGVGAQPSVYPVVLKTVKSQVLRQGVFEYARVCIARHAGEREAFLERWLPYTAVQQQEFLTGRGVGVECLYQHGDLRWAFAHERLHEMPITGGASSYRKAIECSPEMLDATRTLLDALDWHGVAMVEFRARDDGSHVLLEINPRLWGSLPLAIAAGVDFPRGLLQIAQGRDPGWGGEYHVGHRARYLVSDVHWMKENWRADHADPVLLTRPRAGSLWEWFRPLSGQEIWDHFSWSDCGPALYQFTLVWRDFVRSVRSFINSYLHDALTRLRQHGARRRLQRLARGERLRRITFICHGNICRSPFAELLARRRLPGVHVASTGFHTKCGRQTPSRIAAVARGLDVDLSEHRSKTITAEDVMSSDVLVVMDRDNYRLLMGQFPRAAEKTLFLGIFGSRKSLDIVDPFDQDEEGVHRTFEHILDSVDGLVSWLRASSSNPVGSPD